MATLIQSRLTAYGNDRTATSYGHHFAVPVLGTKYGKLANCSISGERQLAALSCGMLDAAGDVAEMMNDGAPVAAVAARALAGRLERKCYDWYVGDALPGHVATPLLLGLAANYPADHGTGPVLADALEEAGLEMMAEKVRRYWTEEESRRQKIAADNAAGICPLRHIYGHSYFGSGSAYGRLDCCDNCEPAGSQDNGFVRGPAAVRVRDRNQPARFVARGGDCIGEGREWSESGEWSPAAQAWEDPR